MCMSADVHCVCVQFICVRHSKYTLCLFPCTARLPSPLFKHPLHPSKLQKCAQIGGILWGSFSDNAGRRRSLMVSLLVNGFAGTGSAFVPEGTRTLYLKYIPFFASTTLMGKRGRDHPHQCPLKVARFFSSHCPLDADVCACV